MDSLNRDSPVRPDVERPKQKRGSRTQHKPFDTTHLAVRPLYMSRYSWADNVKQEQVRSRIDYRLGANYLDAAVPMVTTEQSAGYTLSWDEPSCTAEIFRVDLVNKPSCAWNISAGRVLARDFLDFHDLPNDPQLFESIEKAFMTRIRTLKTKYAFQRLPKHKQEEIKRKKRRYRRKYAVCCLSSLPYICFNCFIVVVPTKINGSHSTPKTTSTRRYSARLDNRRDVK